MKNFFFKSKMSIAGTLLCLILTLGATIILGSINQSDKVNIVYFLIIEAAVIIFWSGLEVRFHWEDKKEISEKSISELKADLINSIKSTSKWTSRSPQQEQLNMILTHSVKKIELAVDEAEGAVLEYKINSKN